MATASSLVKGEEVSFTQSGRTVRTWNKKKQQFERTELPDRKVEGTLTAVSSGKRTVQVAVRTPEGASVTAHLVPRYIYT